MPKSPTKKKSPRSSPRGKSSPKKRASPKKRKSPKKKCISSSSSSKKKCGCADICNIRNLDQLYEQLIKACLYGNFCVVYEILNKQSYSWLPKNIINNALVIASKYGHMNIAKLLMLHDADPSANDNEALNGAFFNKNYDLFYELLILDKSNRVDLNKMFTKVVLEGNKELAEKMLKLQRLDPTANNYIALTLAMQNGNNTIVKLIEKDPRVKITGEQAISRLVLEDIASGKWTNSLNVDLMNRGKK
jgi:hypothetical protein